MKTDYQGKPLTYEEDKKWVAEMLEEFEDCFCNYGGHFTQTGQRMDECPAKTRTWIHTTLEMNGKSYIARVALCGACARANHLKAEPCCPHSAY